MAAMETLSEAIARLTDAGYEAAFHSDGGQLVSGRCDTRVDPSE